MYTPAAFGESDPAVMADLVRRHPLGLLVVAGPAGLQASPVPFLLREPSQGLRLVAHVARANPLWRELQQAPQCLVVFQGAAAYVSPSWYPSKAVTHQVVPTWNYETVQLRGQATVIHDIQWLREQVQQVTDHLEQQRPQPWQVADAPPPFIDAQLRALVGIEIAVSSWQGKWKMSQNRSSDDALGVVRGLSDVADPHADAAVAAAVAARLAARPR